MTTGIYTIINKNNNKRYIGSSNNIEKRLKYHKSLLKNNKHYNKHLQSSFNINLDYFIFNILEICDIKDLLLREKYFMDFFNTLDPSCGFNKAPNPNFGTRGLKWSQESRDKLSKTLIKNYLSGVRAPTSFTHSDEAKSLISKAGIGRVPINRRSIWCHQTGTEYASIHHTARALDISVSGVMDVLSGDIGFVHGYTFEYAEKCNKETRPLIPKTKKVICIETSVVYSSRSDAAKAIGLKGGDVGRAIKNNKKIKDFTYLEVKEKSRE